jgi:regulatory protein
LNDLQNKARQYALRLLSYRGRSEKELKDRMLVKGFSESLVSSTIEHLRDLGYVDDLSLARELDREAISGKFFSHDGARRYLMNRGIPRHVVGMVCSQDREEDLRNAQRYIEKKLRMMKTYPPDTVKRRLYSQLLRRGYSHEAITTVLRNISLNEEV